MIILARYSQTEMCMQLSGADLGGGVGEGGLDGEASHPPLLQATPTYT